MSIKHAIWTVGDEVVPLSRSRIDSEQLLEEMIVKQPGILSDEWMLIGQQEHAGQAGRIDLLAIAPDGSLVLIELKRNRTPRRVMAQALDYAAWVEELGADQIARIYHRFSNGGSLDEDFRERFGSDLDEETLNDSHQIIIVAAELDEATERIVNYLNARDIAINVLFFQVFKHGKQKFLSRAWLIDPGETQSNVAASGRSKGQREPWNGEYYVAFGPLSSRSWEDARKYGFVSAGGGSWYSQTLKRLSPGDRIWTLIPKVGYVGVGRVLEEVCPFEDFEVETPSGKKSAADVLEFASHYKKRSDDPEKAEYFVRVHWLDTVPENEAMKEAGFFGNQNTVCQPRTKKWRHTVDRLKTRFKNWNQGGD